MYSTAGEYTVKVFVWDDDMSQPTTPAWSQTVTVNAVVPTITAPSPVNEGQRFTLNLSAPTEVSSWFINWGDGTTDGFWSGQPAEHTYADDGPSRAPTDVYTISVIARRNSFDSAPVTTSITVNNVAPEISTITFLGMNGSGTAYRGDPLSLEFHYSDVGMMDSHSYEIDWGDGTEPTEAGVFGGTGTLSHTYAEIGTYLVSILLKDDDGGEKVEVAVAEIPNRPPVAMADSYEVEAGEHAVFNKSTEGDPRARVIVNDTDLDGHLLVAQVIEEPDDSLYTFFTFNGDGSFSIEPKPSAAGQSISFRYEVSDGHGGKSSATVTVTVVAPKLSAAKDEYHLSWTAATGGTVANLSISAPGVLSNDESAPGRTLQAVRIVTAPRAGTAALNANGSFTYAPNNGWATGIPEYQVVNSEGVPQFEDAAQTVPRMQRGDYFIYEVTDGVTTKRAVVELHAPKRYVRGDAANIEVVGKGRLVLVGGGAEPIEAMQWMIDHANGGDFVILSASGNPAIYPDWIWSDPALNGQATLNSVETLVINSRTLANDEAIIEALEGAEAIFIEGGDQYSYFLYWNDTPIEAALNAALSGGTVVVGGTSAGLHILGGDADYSGENGSVDSSEAIANPFNNRMTFRSGFVQAPDLSGVITDTHFQERSRMGRLIAFGAVQRMRGLGVNEGTAILIETSSPNDGRARVVGASSAYFMGGMKLADLQEGNPIDNLTVNVRKVSAGTEFTFAHGWTWSQTGFGEVYTVLVDDGYLHRSTGGVNPY
jgi:cyanophycinase